MWMFLLLGAAYLYYKSDASIKAGTVAPNPPISGDQTQGQPSQQSPVKYVYDPRVDTANQPWYGGNQIQNPQTSPAPTTLPSQSSPIQQIWENLDQSKNLGDPYTLTAGGVGKDITTVNQPIYTKADQGLSYTAVMPTNYSENVFGSQATPPKTPDGGY